MVQTTGNFIPTFSAAQGALTFIDDVSSTDLSAAYNTLTTISDNQLIQVKDLTITIPKQEAGKEDLLGLNSTTAGNGQPVTGSFQNQFHFLVSATEAEVSGTMILTLASQGSGGLLGDLSGLVAGDGQTVGSFTRLSFGNCATGVSKKLTGALMAIFNNGTSSGYFMMVDPIVNWEEINPTGTEGHWELSFTAKVLAENFAVDVEQI